MSEPLKTLLWKAYGTAEHPAHQSGLNNYCRKKSEYRHTIGEKDDEKPLARELGSAVHLAIEGHLTTVPLDSTKFVMTEVDAQCAILEHLSISTTDDSEDVDLTGTLKASLSVVTDDDLALLHGAKEARLRGEYDPQ
jgi:hypothetical protein